jgi:predicted DNA-binding transcriptional regulator AlpA
MLASPNMMEPSAYNLNTLDRLMPLAEVAKAISRSVREVWREISRGKLPKPVPGRPARLFESDVQKYLMHLRDERDGKSKDGKE